MARDKQRYPSYGIDHDSINKIVICLDAAKKEAS